jgi:hypothetical protein
MHYGQLPGIVEHEAGNTFAGWGMGRFGEILELPAIDKGLKDILLDVGARRFLRLLGQGA